MKIRYLGTAAYEGVPALFCTCNVCEEARKQGGRHFRSRSQTLINDELLLDFPPDTVWHAMRFGLDWNNIHNCLITHSHSDHLYPEDVEMAAKDYTGNHAPIHFYAAADGSARLHSITDKSFMKGAAIVHTIEPGQKFRVESGKQYEVLPLWANHDSDTSPVIYAISCGQEKLLYAHDTGVFPEQTWNSLKGNGIFGLVSLDCTGCLGLDGDWRDGHMSLRTNLEVVERMKQEKLIDDHTQIVLNHFSHNAGQGYNVMTKEAERYGFQVSYDGMEIEFE